MTSCKYCKAITDPSQKEHRVLYKENMYADIYLGKALNNKPVLFVVRTDTPKYTDTDSVSKNEPITSFFFINYCPNCGAKLRNDDMV